MKPTFQITTDAHRQTHILARLNAAAATAVHRRDCIKSRFMLVHLHSFILNIIFCVCVSLILLMVNERCALF